MSLSFLPVFGPKFHMICDSLIIHLTPSATFQQQIYQPQQHSKTIHEPIKKGQEMINYSVLCSFPQFRVLLFFFFYALVLFSLLLLFFRHCPEEEDSEDEGEYMFPIGDKVQDAGNDPQDLDYFGVSHQILDCCYVAIEDEECFVDCLKKQFQITKILICLFERYSFEPSLINPSRCHFPRRRVCLR